MPAAREGWGSMKGMRANCRCARLELGWPVEGWRREQHLGGGGGGVRRRSGEWSTTGRPWEGSAGPGGVEALGGAAQRRVRVACGEQQHAGGGMARERARKLAKRAGTRRA